MSVLLASLSVISCLKSVSVSLLFACLEKSFMFFLLLSAIHIFPFSKNISVCQMIWIQIRRKVLFGLIWIKTVCKGFLQTTLSGNRVKSKVCNLAARKVHVPTILPAKSDSDFMFCLQSYQALIIERSFVY